MLIKKIHNSARSKGEQGPDEAAAHSALRIDLNTNFEERRRLTSAESAEIRERQIVQATRAVPLHMFFLVCACLTIGLIDDTNLTQTGRLGWYFAGFLPVVLLGLSWIMARQKFVQQSIVRTFEIAALVEGLAWTVPMSYMLSGASSSSQTIIIGVSLAVAGVGALAMVRMPVGAVILSSLIVGAASHAIYLYIDDSSLAPPILCAIYGIVLIGIVVSMHWEFLRATKAELEVSRQRQVIALLLNDFERGTSDWLWETDRDGRLTYFSQRFGEALGKAESDILNATLASLVEPEQDEGGWAAFSSAMVREEDIPSQILSLRVNGKSVRWQMTARPLTSDDGRFLGYRGVGRDVSEKWSADAAVREARDTAERANVAKSQFLSIVGHEVRTPLNAIVGFTELLISPQGDAMAFKSKRDFLQTILESAHQLQNLINDVLDTTRIEKGTLRLLEQDIEAAEIIEIAAKLCRDQAEKSGVNVEVSVFDDVKLNGDQARLKQVVLNLLSNAIKFSPAGSVVRAGFQRGASNEFVFTVKDAGIGIRPEDVERIFEPFVQADEGTTRRFGGLGLGLALARKIARLHGGDIMLESAPGSGTLARLVIPPSRVTWPQASMRPAAHQKTDVAA